MSLGIITWARTRSPWLIHFNSCACNACDIEIVASLAPRYDFERIGAICRGSPRHADVLIVTGAVSRKCKARLLRVYEQMPEPKYVVAMGSCAVTGGPVQDCYNVLEGVDKVIPVNAYVLGCPPKPEAIIDGVMKLLKSVGY